MLFSVRICYCKSGKTKVIFFDKENFNFQLKVLEYKISLNGRNKNLRSHMFLICLSSLVVFMGRVEACPGPARHF